MINVALLGIIRRWYIRDHISIREIARRLDISRNTVRRYIRSDAIEPAHTRQGIRLVLLVSLLPGSSLG